MDPATCIGFVGMVLIVAAYAYMTAQEEPNPFLLHGMNLLGAVLLAVSLLVHTNWPSLMLEAIWICVALWGLAKAIFARRELRKNHHDYRG